MTRLAFDIEGDNLLDKATTVHCIVMQDIDTGLQSSFSGPGIAVGLGFLGKATELWGHNIVDYDLPLLKKLYGFEYTGGVYDTLRGSRQAYPGDELGKRDFILVRRGQMPSKVQRKPHSLEAWGYRLQMPKGEHTDFSVFTLAMLDYCQQDVRLLVRLIEHLLKRTSKAIIGIETQVAQILFEQSQTGVGFDELAAAELAGSLSARREVLTQELRALYPPWFVKDGPAKVSKVNNNKRGIVKGAEYQNIKMIEFNPASGEHISRVLQKHRGWKPHDFTDGGLPKTEEKILSDLPWPECRLMVEYQKIKKLLGYISEGEMAWLRLVRGGSLHGRVHATGTVTNRMSHVEPNLGQVPKVGKPFGRECRSLFVARPGYVLVGADASGLQLRMMAHYLAPYDEGAFARVIENDEDVHLYMQTDTGLFMRDNKKTSNYAWLFGAGHYKLGTIAIFDMQQAYEAGVFPGPVPKLSRAVSIGKRVKDGLIRKLRMGAMEANLKRAADRGWLRGLDGREIPVLSQHKALNTLLMGGEAVVMKHALLRVDPQIRALGARMVLNVHDEWQAEARPENAEQVGQTMVQAIRDTGAAFGLRCRLDGKYKIGTNWAETH